MAAKKCANCVLCEYNTNVDDYVDGVVSVTGLNERQKHALEVISRVSRKRLTGKPMGSYCLGDHPHFRCRTEMSASGAIFIKFQTIQTNYETCHFCHKLNERIRLEGDDGSSP